MVTHFIEQLLMEKRASKGMKIENVRDDVLMIIDILDNNHDIVVNDRTPFTLKLTNLITEEIDLLFLNR